ncbi:hypothetical protein ACEPUE_35280, partial [Burkholderia ubonensis]
ARIDRDELEAILQTDPFVTEGLANYRVTEFRMTRAAPGVVLPGDGLRRRNGEQAGKEKMRDGARRPALRLSRAAVSGRAATG